MAKNDDEMTDLPITLLKKIFSKSKCPVFRFTFILQAVLQEVEEIPMRIFWLIMLAFSFACSKSTETGSEISGLGNLAFVWPHAEASVCIRSVDSKVYDSVRDRAQVFDSEGEVIQFIKNAVDNEFNKKTTFTFTGFEKCRPSQTGDIRVDVKSIGLSRATIGTARHDLTRNYFWNPLAHFVAAASSDMYLYLHHPGSLPNWPKERILAIFHNTIIHEFGHAAGLEHEQARSDNETGMFCNEGRDVGKQRESSVSVGGYDHDSIMNYCNTALFSERRLSLSEGDVKTIRYLYGDPKNKFPGANPDFSSLFFIA